MNELMKEALRLEKLKDTEYAEEHPAEWEAFDKQINAAYDRGELTDDQFNELALIAFFDYFELKGEEDDN